MDAAAPRLPLSKTAVTALVLSILGLALFPFSILALGFGVAGILATRRARKRGRGIAILALLLAPLTLGTTALEGMQLPKIFGSPEVAAMTMEARVNLPSLVKAVKAEQKKSGKLPLALPRTPAQVPCGSDPQAWPSDAAPGWKALGFAPDGPVRYAYEYAPDADGKSFVVRAYGDIDCDGKSSVWEMRPGNIIPHSDNPLD
jgi:hypothetical protein